jgi:hypothetical protein
MILISKYTLKTRWMVFYFTFICFTYLWGLMMLALSESGWTVENCLPLNGHCHGFGHAHDHESVNGHENVNVIFAF